MCNTLEGSGVGALDKKCLGLCLRRLCTLALRSLLFASTVVELASYGTRVVATRRL